MPPTVGVVGGGQLARMLLPAASRLALPVVLLAAPDDAAVDLCRDVIPGRADREGLRRLAARCDVLTVEHELVDLDELASIEQEGQLVRPSAAALRTATDKARQRAVLGREGVPLAPWVLADGLPAVEAFADEHGWPLMLKRPAGGYDGRGVWPVGDAEAAAAVLAAVGGAVLAEPFLPIDVELAVLVARRPGGETAVYPAVQTRQEDGMCREVLLPAPVDAVLAEQAQAIAVGVAEAVDVVGVLAVELFVCDGGVLLNELAARPHNAGHVTIEGVVTCQFENHLRAVADLPLGSTQLRGPAAMVNVVGRDGDPRERLLAALSHRDVAVHLYGKQARPGRKLGHVTATGPDLQGALDRARLAAGALMGADPG